LESRTILFDSLGHARGGVDTCVSVPVGYDARLGASREDGYDLDVVLAIDDGPAGKNGVIEVWRDYDDFGHQLFA
jgi:hypothetical protein